MLTATSPRTATPPSAIPVASTIDQRPAPAGTHSPQPMPMEITYKLSYGRNESKKKSLPGLVSLSRSVAASEGYDQLFIDFLPLPKEAWNFDVNDRVLTWQDANGVGQLFFTHAGRGGGIGCIDTGVSQISIVAAATANFTCSVAENVGASLVMNGQQVTGFKWDDTSAPWKSAAWEQQRLLLSYSYTPGTAWQPGTVAFSFTDTQTDDSAQPWTPDADFSADLNLIQRNDGLCDWFLDFQSQCLPPSDTGAAKPDSVFPVWLQAREDMAAQNINGVMAIDHMDPLKARLIGIQGQQPAQGLMGYFQLSNSKTIVGVFMGRMVLDGQLIDNSFATGNTLHWFGLQATLQKQYGLPANGSISFNVAGANVSGTFEKTSLRRLNGAECMQLLAEPNLYPASAARIARVTDALQQDTLNIQGLILMSPYTKVKGQWYDQVQQAVTGDLQQIMNSCIPATMWQLLYPSVEQPTLSSELTIVANSPVKNVKDPKSWYRSLAAAVLTSGMAGAGDPNCRNMNGPRAAEWLKTQVAGSAVYHAHSQLLFAYEWAKMFPIIDKYLTDQKDNTSGATYQANIKTIVSEQINAINQNVQPDPSDPGQIGKLIAIVNDLQSYTNNNDLYWALCYYLYNTSPNLLANIALQMSSSTGSPDPTVISRLFQKNMSVLTALDPSGYFAKKYIQTINVFMVTNIMPSMFGFKGDCVDPDMIRLYMQQFVTNNLHSEDQQIRQAAEQIQTILAGQHADAFFKSLSQLLVSSANAINDAMALPIIAEKFLKQFKNEFPKLSGTADVICSLAMGGITVLNCMMLIKGYGAWKKLNDEEKAELVTDSAQLGLQLVAAVIKRGVRIYALFDAETLGTWGRLAGISKIMATGGDSVISDAMRNVSGVIGKWFGSITAPVVDEDDAEELGRQLVINSSEEIAPEEVSMTVRVFGKNLDEFIGTRITPIFIFCAIGYSIYTIAEGEDSLEEASDIINIVSGTLMLVSIGAGVAGCATFATVAGGLSIVAALVGIGLMIYQLSQTPPDPVQEFVDQYVKPAGFYVSGQASSIDYVNAYADPNQGNLLMLGFSLGVPGKILSADADGTISLVNTNNGQPATTWKVLTDGLGVSRIFTVIQSDPATPPAVVYLSLMKNNTVGFHQALESKPNAAISTQRWYATPQGSATLAKGTQFLQSIDLVLQPVVADNNGKYLPANASGYLVQQTSGVGFNATAPGTVFTLTMSGIAPNYMTMRNIKVDAGTTLDNTEQFAPSFGTSYVSGPCSFSLSPAAPSFLAFDAQTGILQATGQTVPTQPSVTQEQLQARNALGQSKTSFSIIVQNP